MEKEMDPVLGMYAMLEAFLPPGSMEKEEVDKITVRVALAIFSHRTSMRVWCASPSYACVHTMPATYSSDPIQTHKKVLRSSWKRLLKQAETRTDELTRKQVNRARLRVPACHV